MKITIHRGIDQIGGCITEIATNNTRILIDLGQNLPDNEGNINDPLATKEEIEKLTSRINAVIYTHYHGDHIGLFNLVPKDKDQYIGETAQQVALCKHRKLGQIKGREELSAQEVEAISLMKAMSGGKTFIVGDIIITPYFVSHSAYESFMLLIEADGKLVLHTGDFRDHGYLGKGLTKVLKTHIRQVDILITEGTMLSRGDEQVRHENELKQEFIHIMKDYKNCFVVCSSSDLERLTSIYAAHRAVRPQAPFICDEFQKDIFDIFSQTAVKIKTELFNFRDIVTFESKQADIWHSGFTMLVRCTDKFGYWVDKLLPKIKPDNTVIIFSMWGEYINASSRHAKREYLDFVAKFPNQRKLHTSGHASRECLTEVCELTNPKLCIIPIHSEQSNKYLDLPITQDQKSKVIFKSSTIGDLNVEIK